MYQFENLWPYMGVEERANSRSSYPYGWDKEVAKRRRENDKLLEFTLSKHATLEAENNYNLMLSKCREADMSYLVLGNNGTQVVGPYVGSDTWLQDASRQIFTDQFFEAINTEMEKERERRGYSGGSKFGHAHLRTARTEGGCMFRFHQWESKNITLKKFRGVWDVKTGKKLKRQECIEAFWKLGFLSERRVIMYAGAPSYGSVADVRSYQDLQDLLNARTNTSTALKRGLRASMRRIDRDYAYPSNWRALDSEFNLV